MRDFVVLDIETTGLSKHRHKITEIAGIKIRNGKKINEFQTLVNPEVHIPSFITKLTSIDDEMVKNAPTIERVLPYFLEFLDKNVFVAHNATFDYGFLYHNTENYLTQTLANERLCTRKLANRLLPELPSKKLSCLCEYLKVTNTNAHRALADAHATADIFLYFLDVMRKNGVRTWEDIQKFERMPARRNQPI